MSLFLTISLSNHFRIPYFSGIILYFSYEIIFF